MTATIMIVEDEADLSLMLRYNLEAEGFKVAAAATGDEAAEMVRDAQPDLILLDWMLPGLSGIELCRRWRAKQETASIPIIMLTARGEEEERVRGLETGADDYVVKPFSIPELLARIHALLRRSSPQLVTSILKAGDLELDRTSHRVRRSGRDVHLGPTEYRLLEYLMRSPGRVYSREQLLDAVWGTEGLCRRAHGRRACGTPAQGDQSRPQPRPHPHRPRQPAMPSTSASGVTS